MTLRLLLAPRHDDIAALIGLTPPKNAHLFLPCIAVESDTVARQPLPSIVADKFEEEQQFLSDHFEQQQFFPNDFEQQEQMELPLCHHELPDKLVIDPAALFRHKRFCTTQKRTHKT